MENATEALKMAFAVLVFVIAMTAAFMLVTGARSTADVIFTSKDEQEYVKDITSIGQDTSKPYREVGIDTIIPTIYRYAQENYGVIIIDEDEGGIVGIYDLVVENTVSKYYSTWDINDNNNELTKLCKGTDDKEGIAQYIKMATNIDINDISTYESLFEKIYEIQIPTSVSCPWTSSTYNIMQRIKVDMEGVTEPHEFGNGTLKYRGAFYDDNPAKNGFVNKYGKDDVGNPITFKEYYYNVKTTNNLTEEEETDRIQIIYVKN